MPTKKGSHRRTKQECNICACGDHAWGRTNRWGVVIVDVCDRIFLSSYVWTLSFVGNVQKCGYAVRMATGNVYTTLHGVILPPPPGFLIDHKNSNGLDNRRCNLRIATSQGNAANARKTPGFSSHFKGVRWHKSKMWTAQIKVNYQQKYLGSFVTEEEAARVYDAAAFAEWGDMARLNFPIDTAAVAAGNDWAGVPDEF